MEIPPFASFFMGGFECSTHRLSSKKRLDLIAATQHDKFVRLDYARLKQMGISTLRDGIRWHLIEQKPNQYDFSSVLPFIQAADEQGMQVIWDLCHYGWPDGLDIFRPEFVRSFSRMSCAFAHFYQSETDAPLLVCPINEISFFAWAGGDAAQMGPFERGRSFELKTQLVRATIEGIEAIWDVIPDARIVTIDPLIHVVADPNRPEERVHAEGYQIAQYQAWDMLEGSLWPQLGGNPKYLDILGVNFYPLNQWVFGGETIFPENPDYRPLRDMLQELYDRYQRPMFIAETGTEDAFRPQWLRYVATEVMAAIQKGISVEGICWYPILCHPGWENDRYCSNGFWGYADERGYREVDKPLKEEWLRLEAVFEPYLPSRNFRMD